MNTITAPTDFDFIMGSWTVVHRRLNERLAGCTEWTEFSGTSTTRKILQGFGNIEDNVLDFREGRVHAVALRSFDVATRTWAIWWLDGRAPHRLDVPVVGSFVDGVGTFHASGRKTHQGAVPVAPKPGRTAPLGTSLFTRWRPVLGAQLDDGVFPPWGVTHRRSVTFTLLQPSRPPMRSILLAVVEYLLGFLALALFAFLAFGSGPPTDERLLFAFKVAAPVAVVELAVLWWRAAPANRLILGANLWLTAGGVAALLQQWWWLKGYQQFGEAGLFVAMALVGLATTAFSPAGFVAVIGPRRPVVLASFGLLAAVLLALWAAVHFRGDVKFAAVFPVIALSWLNRLLRRMVRRGQGASP